MAKFTKFMDMHSGGSQKEDHGYIIIEAPEAEAKVIFYNRFGHDPERVTCTCCGEDYSITEDSDLAQLTGFDRGGQWFPNDHEAGGGHYEGGQPVEEYLKGENVLYIPAADIKDEERKGEIPQSGWVWHGNN